MATQKWKVSSALRANFNRKFSKNIVFVCSKKKKRSKIQITHTQAINNKKKLTKIIPDQELVSIMLKKKKKSLPSKKLKTMLQILGTWLLRSVIDLG